MIPPKNDDIIYEQPLICGFGFSLQLSQLTPLKQKAITDIAILCLVIHFVMTKGWSCVRNGLWLMGEGVQMSGKKEHGNKKVWNREEQVWGVESRQHLHQSLQSERGTFLCTFKLQAVVWYGRVWFGLVWKKPPRARRQNHLSHFFKTLLSKLDLKGAKSLITDCEKL